MIWNHISYVPAIVPFVRYLPSITIAGVPGIPDSIPSDHPIFASVLLFVAGLIILTTLMHLARALVRGHASLAKSLLVVPGA